MFCCNYLECSGCLGCGPTRGMTAEIYTRDAKRERSGVSQAAACEQTYPLFGVDARPLFSFHPAERKKKKKHRTQRQKRSRASGFYLRAREGLNEVSQLMSVSQLTVCLTCACWGWSRPPQPRSGGWPYGPATTPRLHSPTRAARPQTWSPAPDWGSRSPRSCHSQKEPWWRDLEQSPVKYRSVTFFLGV